jgi:hypothetical protein
VELSAPFYLKDELLVLFLDEGGHHDFLVSVSPLVEFDLHFHIAPIFDQEGQLQVVGNLVEVRAFRVRKANQTNLLVQHGVILYEVDV